MFTQFLPSLRNLRKRLNYSGPAVLIMDGFSAHKNTIKSLNLIQDNLKIHFLVAHSSDQTQPLDLSIFGIAKQFMSNYKYNNSISRQSNQIIKIYTALAQATTQAHCRAAFRGIGIEPVVRFVNNKVQILTNFNLNLINKVREYQISQIIQLVNTHLPLTPNQQYIYQNYIRNTQPNSNSNIRFSIPSFPVNMSKPLIPMPNILYPQNSS